MWPVGRGKGRPPTGPNRRQLVPRPRVGGHPRSFPQVASADRAAGSGQADRGVTAGADRDCSQGSGVLRYRARLRPSDAPVADVRSRDGPAKPSKPWRGPPTRSRPVSDQPPTVPPVPDAPPPGADVARPFSTIARTLAAWARVVGPSGCTASLSRHPDITRTDAGRRSRPSPSIRPTSHNTHNTRPCAHASARSHGFLHMPESIRRSVGSSRRELLVTIQSLLRLLEYFGAGKSTPRLQQDVPEQQLLRRLWGAVV